MNKSANGIQNIFEAARCARDALKTDKEANKTLNLEILQYYAPVFDFIDALAKKFDSYTIEHPALIIKDSIDPNFSLMAFMAPSSLAAKTFDSNGTPHTLHLFFSENGVTVLDHNLVDQNGNLKPYEFNKNYGAMDAIRGYLLTSMKDGYHPAIQSVFDSSVAKLNNDQSRIFMRLGDVAPA